MYKMYQIVLFTQIKTRLDYVILYYVYLSYFLCNTAEYYCNTNYWSD